MKPILEFTWDENLREVPSDPAALRQHIDSLRSKLKEAVEPVDRVRVLGELGVRLRTLGELDEAEDKIKDALKTVHENNLGIRWEIQQKIRLAHILQWKKAFAQSNAIFSEIIDTCRTNGNARTYLDFALQHAGKNFFDQKRLNEALQSFEEALRLRQERQAPAEQIGSTVFSVQRTKQLISKKPSK